jgi:uncharacterized protein
MQKQGIIFNKKFVVAMHKKISASNYEQCEGENLGKFNNNIALNNFQVSERISKAEQERQFAYAYQLAYETNGRKNWKNIFAFWYSAASNGHVRSQFYVGVCFDNGYGVEKNIKKAYKWYLKAAKNGHMESQYNIGFFYREGEVVKRNHKKAVQWYALAAAKGDTEAQRDLGYCYFYGRGIKKDEKEAVHWYKKAAAKNDDKALYNLGLCYKYGRGVNQSDRWAKYYFKKAIKLGHKAAKRQLKNFDDKTYRVGKSYL